MNRFGESPGFEEKNDPNKVYILEIGPSHGSLAESFYGQFQNLRVVFVAIKRESDFSSPVTDSIFVEADIMDYVRSDDLSHPPGGFDYIVMQNVLSAPKGKLNDLSALAKGLGTILKSGGTVIIEETYASSHTMGTYVADIFSNNGFEVNLSQERSGFFERPEQHAFHLEARI